MVMTNCNLHGIIPNAIDILYYDNFFDTTGADVKQLIKPKLDK